jgi:hypothetical protein
MDDVAWPFNSSNTVLNGTACPTPQLESVDGSLVAPPTRDWGFQLSLSSQEMAR